MEFMINKNGTQPGSSHSILHFRCQLSFQYQHQVLGHWTHIDVALPQDMHAYMKLLTHLCEYAQLYIIFICNSLHTTEDYKTN
jgi:hypothetical protein